MPWDSCWVKVASRKWADILNPLLEAVATEFSRENKKVHPNDLTLYICLWSRKWGPALFTVSISPVCPWAGHSFPLHPSISQTHIL